MAHHREDFVNAAHYQQIITDADCLCNKNSDTIFGLQGRRFDVESQSECASAKRPFGEHVRRANLRPRILSAGLSQPGAKTAARGTGKVLLQRKFPALLDNAALLLPHFQ